MQAPTCLFTQPQGGKRRWVGPLHRRLASLARPPPWPAKERLEVRNSRQRVVVSFGKISAKFRSFSAVSKRNFASKYAFDSIFQNLPDYLAEILKFGNFFANFAT